MAGFGKNNFNNGFNNNNFNNGFNGSRVNNSYNRRKELEDTIEQLPEEEKKKLDRQRNIFIGIFILAVVVIVGVMAIFGIGVDEDVEEGNLFVGESRVRIAFFGDSITEGYSLDEDGEAYIVDTTYVDVVLNEITDAYPEIFLKFTNYGISGDIGQADSYQRVDGDETVAVVLYMVNNFIYGEEYEGILEANIDGFEEEGMEVILLNYPVYEGGGYESEIEACNEYIEEVSESEGVSLYDTDEYFKSLIEEGTYTEDDLFASDGIHLSETGYKVLGAFVADILIVYEAG